MAISVLQRPAGFNTASANSDVQTLSGVTTGSLVIAAARIGSNITATCSDGTNGAWSVADHSGTASGTLYVFYFLNSASGNLSVTLTITVGGPQTIRWCFVEVAPGAGKTWDKLDQHLIASGTSTAPDSGNVTTTVNDEYALGQIDLNAGTTTVTAGTGWTLRTQVATSKLSIEDQILTATGTITGNATLGTSDTWSAGVFTWAIKAAAGGRGLFEQTPMNGLGVGGSFFANPLG